MKSLNPTSSEILKYIVDNVPLEGHTFTNKVCEHFSRSYPEKIVLAALKELNNRGYIILDMSHDETFGGIILTPEGIMYSFDEYDNQISNYKFADRQHEILLFILEEPLLKNVMNAFSIGDHTAFKKEFDNRPLFDYSDDNYDDKTEVYLKNQVQAIVEDRERYEYRCNRAEFISAISLLISFFAFLASV